MTSTGHGVQEGTFASQLNHSPHRRLPEGSCLYSNLQINLSTLSSCPFLMEQAAWTGFISASRRSLIVLSLSMEIGHTWADPQDSGLGAFLKGSLRGMLVPHTATAVKKRGGTGNTGQGGSHRSCGGLNVMNSSRLSLESDAGDYGCGLRAAGCSH